MSGILCEFGYAFFRPLCNSLQTDSCTAGQVRLAAIGRFDMPNFEAPAPYVREMRRYGVLTAEAASIDPYAADRVYWDSFSQAVALTHPAYEDR